MNERLIHDSGDQLEASQSTSSAEAPGLFRLVLDSLRGKHHDFTRGDLRQAIMMLAIPMVLEMIMESIFAVVDAYFVSHLHRADALATVSLTESMMTMVYTVALGLSIGATAMVARRIGEKDERKAALTAVQAIILGVIISIALGVTGALLAPKLLSLMGASPNVIAYGSNYARVALGMNICVMMLFLANAILRGAGDAATAMRVLWLANGINILLGPCLIFGLGPFPKLGVTGAAVATVIGRGTGAVFATAQLLRPRGRIRIELADIRIELQLMMRLLRLSWTAMVQIFIGMASWIGLVRILSTFGDTALAGYLLGLRVILFALFPSFGMSNAAATIVGQSLGAKKPERAELAVWRTGFYNCCFLGVIGLLYVIFAAPIIAAFGAEPAVSRYGVETLRIVALGFPFYAYGMVLSQSFNGAGDTRTPTLISLVVFWLFELPLAYLLSIRFGFGPRGVFISITIAFSALAVVSALLFKRGAWKQRMV